MNFISFPSLLQSARHVAVVSHYKPDGDCIGAQIALCGWLKAHGVECTAYNEDTLPGNLTWLCEETSIEPLTAESFRNTDIVIFVDGNHLNRFSRIQGLFEGLEAVKMMIDHHPEPAVHEFDYTFSEVSASSTCQLIWELYEQTNETRLTPLSAKALYTGLVTDTGSFQFDSVTPKTLESAAKILRLGDFKPNEVIERVFSAKTLATQQALGAALSRLYVYDGGKISVITLPYEVVAEYEAVGEVDTDGFVNHGLHIEGVDVALFCKESAPGEIKCSLRSRHHADVNQWARKLGGGGHVRAAGVLMRGTVDSAIERLLDAGRELYPELFT